MILARNCAVILVEEPFSRDLAIIGGPVQWSLAADLAGAVSAPLLDLRLESEFVVDDALMAKFAGLKRRSLILFGTLLEGAVTQIALTMLLEGYDVYVCADQVRSADPKREAVFLERIRYCAGHVVTLPQILLELLSRVENDKSRRSLRAVLDMGARRCSAAGL